MRYPAILLLLLLISACSSSRHISQVVRQEIQPDRIAGNEQLIISGTIKDTSGKPIIFASIAAYDNNLLIAGTESDFDGAYQLQLGGSTQDLTIELSYVGMKTTRYDIGMLQAGQYQLNGTMSFSDASIRVGCGAYHWGQPLIEMDNMTSGATFTGDQLQRMPAYRGGSN